MRCARRGLLPEVVFDESMEHGTLPGADLEDGVLLREWCPVREVRHHTQRPELIIERAPRARDARMEEDGVEAEARAEFVVSPLQAGDVIEILRSQLLLRDHARELRQLARGGNV